MIDTPTSQATQRFQIQKQNPVMPAGPKGESNMKNDIILTDTFNGRKISTHRTVLAAVKAEKKHLAAVKRANGSSSYLTYSITAADGRDLGEEIDQARMEIE